jgi:octaprenyl-diphosphate synthase
MCLVAEAAGGGEDDALPLAPLVELPHNASLIHDDIEDNSDKRRGEPAIHVRYGLDTAINSGSFEYFLPLFCVNEWDAEDWLKNAVFGLWGDHLRRLHLGQALDIAWHRDPLAAPSIAEYKTMCGLKTGSLSRLAAMLGVVCAHAVPPAQSKALAGTLGNAAEKLGVAFQILDDVKNLTTGNPGKKRGDDIVEGKKSLPVLLYVQKGGGRAKETVARCFAKAAVGGADADEVEELIREMEAAGAIAEAEKQGRTFAAEARAVFAAGADGGFPLRRDRQGLISGLIDMIIGDA